MTTDAWAEPPRSNAKSAHQETTLITLLIIQFEASVIPSLILGSFYHAMGAGVYRLRDMYTQFWDIHLIPEVLRFNTTLTRRGPTRYNPASSTWIVAEVHVSHLVWHLLPSASSHRRPAVGHPGIRPHASPPASPNLPPQPPYEFQGSGSIGPLPGWSRPSIRFLSIMAVVLPPASFPRGFAPRLPLACSSSRSAYRELRLLFGSESQRELGAFLRRPVAGRHLNAERLLRECVRRARTGEPGAGCLWGSARRRCPLSLVAPGVGAWVRQPSVTWRPRLPVSTS
jgi:hypothetical protein